jgi:hypothetical protein
MNEWMNKSLILIIFSWAKIVLSVLNDVWFIDVVILIYRVGGKCVIKLLHKYRSAFISFFLDYGLDLWTEYLKILKINLER